MIYLQEEENEENGEFYGDNVPHCALKTAKEI